ncbi:ABC transporter permease [Demequina mangrovi]|uniref:Putative spermidine/putrescine transport system permease protein n=1 Tax=Demequina mangrovi TaxID=1043493 RepID=A0A1H6ZV62_9MICO|nr:ABC transporter permease [Demequina mangrovi]SEJ57231.1 putative spermidine/putrescine transport system permease protein [Demequina mangrovi]
MTTHRVSAFLAPRRRLRLAGLLTAPVLWLGLVYVVALSALLVTAFWTVDELTGQVQIEWTTENVVEVVTEALYRTVTLRTLGIAALVTVIDVLIAVPVAFFMAKVAGPRLRHLLVIAVLAPLWASYLVKVYSWRALLSSDGIIEWVLSPFGLHTPGYGIIGVVLALSYLWLPYVIMPIYAGFDRVPDRLLEASADLGGRGWRTLTAVVLPMIRPAIIAGSIFAFSLSLGDYITTGIVGGTTQMLGNLVYTNVGAANNLPLAAAISLIPIGIILVYLAAVRRTGALRSL